MKLTRIIKIRVNLSRVNFVEAPRLLKSWITSEPFKLWPPNKATFPKNYLGKFASRDYVYINIDVTIATEFWQPCF